MGAIKMFTKCSKSPLTLVTSKRDMLYKRDKKCMQVKINT